MKKNSAPGLLFIIPVLICISSHAQELIKYAPPGFDSLRDNISHGVIDTITYTSKTVGNSRRAIIYTPIERAFAKADIAFEFINKMGLPYYCFHDVDAVDYTNDVIENEKTLRAITAYLKQK